MGPTLYDYSSKQWVNVPDDTDVTASVASGQYGFDKDMDVPVIDENGQLTQVKGEQAAPYFQGHPDRRFANYNDAKAWYDTAMKNNVANAQAATYGADGPESPMLGLKTDEVGDALAMGTGLLGKIPFGNQGVQSAASWAAGLVGKNISPEEIAAQQAADVQAYPDSYKMGGFAGDLLALRGLGKVGLGALGEVGSYLGETIGGAGGLAAKVGIGGAVGATEMAYLGGVNGLTEKSLGNPEDSAENLWAGVASNGILGGLFGGSMGALEYGAPTIKKGLTWTGSLLADAAASTARAGAKGVVVPALKLTGRDELAQTIKGIIDDPDARAIDLFGGGREFLKQASEKAQGLLDDFTGQAAKLHRNIMQKFSKMPDELATAFEEAHQESGGNLRATMDNLYSRQKDAEQILKNSLVDDAQAGAKGSIHLGVREVVQDLNDALGNSGDKSARSLGSNLGQILDGHESAVGITPSSEESSIPHLMSASSEVETALQLRDQIRAGLERTGQHALPANAREELQTAHDAITDQLHAHPVYGETIQAVDAARDAHSAASDILGELGNLQNLRGADRVGAKASLSPDFDAKLGLVAERLPELLPHLDRMASGAADAQEIQNITQMINRTLGVEGRQISVDDMQELAHSLVERGGAAESAVNNRGLLDSIQKLKGMQHILTDSSSTGLDRYAQVLQATGKDTPQNLDKILATQGTAQKLGELRGALKDSDLKNFLVKKLLGGAALGSVLAYADPTGGGTASHALEFGLGTAIPFMLDPESTSANMMDGLTRIEKQCKVGERAMQVMSDFAVDALTGTSKSEFLNKARTGSGRILKSLLSDPVRDLIHSDEAPAPVTKESFKDATGYIQEQVQSVERMHEVALDRIGVSDDAPILSSALHAQYAKALSYVAQQIPQSPVMGGGLSQQQDLWEPSDAELSKFNRVLATVENPLTALADIGKGLGTPEQMQALQNVYPKTFQRLQEGVVNAIMKPNTKLSYANRVQLGTLFGLGADASLQPNILMALQARLQAGGGGAQKQAGQDMGTQMHVRANPKAQFDPDKFQTDTDRVTYS